MKPIKSNRRWSVEQDQHLLDMFEYNYPKHHIAATLKRTEKAIELRLSKLLRLKVSAESAKEVEIHLNTPVSITLNNYSGTVTVDSNSGTIKIG